MNKLLAIGALPVLFLLTALLVSACLVPLVRLAVVLFGADDLEPQSVRGGAPARNRHRRTAG
jgi:hypothetical protein